MRRRTRNVASAAITLLLLSCALETGSMAGKTGRVALLPESPARQAKTDPAGAPSAPTKLALLVGINNYKYPDAVSPLAGSINDVEDMRQVLTTKFEFPPENVLVLKDAEATHAAIINAIQTHLIAKAHPGDIVVFDYSGHGSQMKDVTGKMISGLDETIVPYDSRDPEGKVFDISGAELHGLLLQLAAKTKNLTFILDSCHSGTLVRGARVRSIPADTRTPPPPPSYAVAATRGLEDISDPTSPKFAFIAAATSKESAFEHFAGGKDHGALTYFLARQLRSAKAGATYRDIMDSVIGNVSANYPAQHPSLEGAEADQYVFGDSSSLARSYVVATPLDTAHVSLDVGQVEDATAGSVYEVYAPGTKKLAPPAVPVARVRLTKVDALTSEGRIISGARIAPFSRAVEREHSYGALKMRIYLDGLAKSQTLQSIKDALGPFRQIEVVDNPAICDMQLREVGGRIQTLGADLTTLSTPVPVSEPAVVDRVVDQVKSWAKWFNVLSIHNPQASIDLKFTIKGSQTRDPMARVGRPDMGVWEGETINATLKNDSERDLYIALLDLDTDGSIAVVYPQEQGAKEVLKSGSTLEKSFITTVPRGRSIVTTILKVVASYKPIDLSPLTQGEIRGIPEGGGEPDPLQQLLTDSVGGTRGVALAVSDLGTWTTVQRVLMVRRRR
ncbi:MAG TPA: caspase family protein [Terriglobia bacterium]|nr:caspase family protein [Terriglobia bacterium]